MSDLRHVLEWPSDADDAVMVVGAGVLGRQVVPLLAHSGVRRVHIVDPDRASEPPVGASCVPDGGRLKVDCLADHHDGTTGVQITPWPVFFEVVPDEIVRQCSMVLGCVDSVRSRVRIGRACAAAGIPYLDGGLSDWGAAVSLFTPSVEGPCFRCTVSESELVDEAVRFSCAEGTAVGPPTLSLETTAAVAAGVLVQEALKLRAANPDAMIGGAHLSYSVDTVGFFRSWSPVDPHCQSPHAALDLEEVETSSESAEDVVESISRRLGLAGALDVLWPGVWAYCGRCALGSGRVVVRYDIARNRAVLCEAACDHDDHRVLDDPRRLPAWAATAATALHGRRLHVRGGDPIVDRQILLRFSDVGGPS